MCACDLAWTALALGLLTGCALGAEGPGERAALWAPRDFTFQSARSHGNPFMVSFWTVVKGPNGQEFAALGFYDGAQDWKVRVSPNTPGEWTIETRSDDADLNGRTLSFIAVPNENPSVHGGLRVDGDHPHHFIWEDGTRCFLMGYECDWLWALDADDPAVPTVNRFLDLLAANGFNHIILNTYAHDTHWCRGRTNEHDYGPPPMYAWEGSNENPVHGRLNLTFWRHYDRVLEALWRRGIVAHIMIKVYNKMVEWPAKGSAEDGLYFRWVLARYAAFPNVVWDFSKEAHIEKDLEYKLTRFRLIRAHDPYRRLITNHDDDQAYDAGAYNEFLDFRSDQQHSRWREVILRQRRHRPWPVVNVEFGYEHGPKGMEDKTYKVVQPPEEVCRRAWEICMAGGYVAYYYTYTAWDVVRPEDVPPGYAHFRRLRAFFEGTNYWLLNPADELASEGYCLANPGREYVVFLNQARPFTLRLEGLAEAVRGEWYGLFTGRRAATGSLSNGEAHLTPPAEWGGGPVALHVRAARP